MGIFSFVKRRNKAECSNVPTVHPTETKENETSPRLKKPSSTSQTLTQLDSSPPLERSLRSTDLKRPPKYLELEQKLLQVTLERDKLRQQLSDLRSAIEPSKVSKEDSVLSMYAFTVTEEGKESVMIAATPSGNYTLVSASRESMDSFRPMVDEFMRGTERLLSIRLIKFTEREVLEFFSSEGSGGVQ